MPSCCICTLPPTRPAQKRAYILADNRLAEQAGWDRELLALELGELDDLGIDLDDEDSTPKTDEE